MNLIKYILVILMLSAFSQYSFSQYDYPGESNEEQTRQKKIRNEDSKLFFGGTFGLMLSDNYGYVELAPLAGYKLTPRLWLGGGPKYMFYRLSPFDRHIYGIKTYGLFSVLDNINETTNLGIKSIFVYGENELLNYEQLAYDISGYYFLQPRGWYNIARAGFGMRFPVGGRGGFSIMMLWGFTPTAQEFYSNPDIYISFDF